MGGFKDNNDKPSEHSQKVGLKKVSSQASIFDNKPKKPSQQQFEKDVQVTQQRLTGYKKTGAELTTKFAKVMADKTLPTNKNILNNDVEIELLKDMMTFANEVNNDPNEQEDGFGSLALIAILLKTCISQRNRINELEYSIHLLDKKNNSNEVMVKEIKATLDIKLKNG